MLQVALQQRYQLLYLVKPDGDCAGQTQMILHFKSLQSTSIAHATQIMQDTQLLMAPVLHIST